MITSLISEKDIDDGSLVEQDINTEQGSSDDDVPLMNILDKGKRKCAWWFTFTTLDYFMEYFTKNEISHV